MNMNIEQKIEKNILKVCVTFKVRRSIEEQKIYFRTDDLLEILKGQHEIQEIISKPPIALSNSTGGNKPQQGEWVFKIKPKNTKTKQAAKDEEPKRKQTTRQPRKKPISNRMSNIARNKKPPS